MNQKKLQTFYSNYFRRKSHFETDGTQYYLVFQQYKDDLKGLVILVIIFYWGNLKDCLMKSLSLLLHLTIFLILY